LNKENGTEANIVLRRKGLDNKHSNSTMYSDSHALEMQKNTGIADVTTKFYFKPDLRSKLGKLTKIEPKGV
jgi:hypothetical protein